MDERVWWMQEEVVVVSECQMVVDGWNKRRQSLLEDGMEGGMYG